jgi:ubiquinone/menaquinone biosynthesis C-methylase UbiE
VIDAEHAGYLASGFRNVDAAEEVSKFVSCLQFMDRLKSFQDYKQAIVDRAAIRSGMSVLDVGCGIGADVARIASIVGDQGAVVGLDPSRSLIDTARKSIGTERSNASFVVGFGENLEFPDESFDVCRVDRTLQHVEDPRLVITEMSRSLKSGGRLACAKPDWGTFVITSQDRRLTRRISETWSDGFRNGSIGRWLQPYLHLTGFRDVMLTGHLLIAEGFEAIDKVFDISLTAAKLRDAGDRPQDIDRWIADLKSREDALAIVTLFLATGMKP